MMELRDIDFLFREQEVRTMPVREYREYMTERKKEAKDKAKGNKRKYPMVLLFPTVNTHGNSQV